MFDGKRMGLVCLRHTKSLFYKMTTACNYACLQKKRHTEAPITQRHQENHCFPMV